MSEMILNIVLLRHGAYGAQNLLNDLGIEQIRRIARVLAGDGITINRVYTSSMKRAHQSGEILREELAPHSEPEGFVIPREEFIGANEETILQGDFVEEMRGVGTVALVLHGPTLEILQSALGVDLEINCGSATILRLSGKEGPGGRKLWRAEVLGVIEPEEPDSPDIDAKLAEFKRLVDGLPSPEGPG